MGQVADADIGVVLDDLGLLVLDPDGPAGGQALAEALGGGRRCAAALPTRSAPDGRTVGGTCSCDSHPAPVFG